MTTHRNLDSYPHHAAKALEWLQISAWYTDLNNSTVPRNSSESRDCHFCHVGV